MNMFGTIILIAIFVDFALHFWAERLNLSRLDGNIPDEMKGVYDEDAYRKSQEYTRVRTRFGRIVSVFDLALLAAFWFSGGFQWLDALVRSWSFSPVISGIFFIGLLLAGKSLVSFPFGVYSTFVIEERFGFNKITPSLFIMDTIKGVAIGMVIGVPVLAGILWLFEYLGASAWLFGWVSVTVFSLLAAYIVPAWILPLFNKFTPLEDGDLKRAIMEYARSVNYSLQNVFVMDGSKRSAKANAFFTGFGKNKRIALFDTLIASHSVDELVCVLAHEVGHFKKKHILQSTILGILQTGVMFFLLSQFLSNRALFDAFFMKEMSTYAGLIFFGMLFSPIEFFVGLFMLSLSRKNEFEADRFAVETTRNPETMISALKRLSKDSLGQVNPHPLYVFLNYSHPPVLERVQAIRSVALS